jgi:hypothetical protein
MPKDTSVIPDGGYCYSGTPGSPSFKPCPYWTKSPNHSEQNNGYCHYLATGDWMGPGWGLLWDMCKECGIKHPGPIVDVKHRG